MKSVSKKTQTSIACVLAAIVFLSMFVSGINPPSRRITLLSTTIEYPQNVKDNSSDQWQTVSMRVTAYCPCKICCGKYSDGRTSNNHKIEEGDAFAAADRNIPFLSELLVPGYNDNKPVKVMDRGSSIKDDRLDIFFDSHQKAKNWGVKYLNVKLKVSKS